MKRIFWDWLMSWLKLSEELVDRLLAEGYAPYVLFSGGRDSLATLHLVNKIALEKGVKVVAVHIDTTVMTPGNLKYVRETCRELNVTLKVLRPKEDFFSLVEKWGFPTATRRWCCYHLKIEPMTHFFKSIKKPKVVFDGIRREESPRRRNFPVVGWRKRFEALNCHPIFHWTKQNVLDYIKKFKLKENPLYKIFPRAADCWCTAFKTPEQFKQLKKHYPQFFKKFVEAEAKLKTGGSALFRQGRKIYLRDL